MELKNWVIKFLEMNYEVYGGFGIKMREKASKELYEINQSLALIVTLFSDTDINGQTPKHILTEWVAIKEAEMTKDLKEYLNHCNVRLGRTSWDTISMENKPVTEYILLGLFGEKMSHYYIKKYFDDWQEERVYEESERIMKRY